MSREQGSLPVACFERFKNVPFLGCLVHMTPEDFVSASMIFTAKSADICWVKKLQGETICPQGLLFKATLIMGFGMGVKKVSATIETRFMPVLGNLKLLIKNFNGAYS